MRSEHLGSLHFCRYLTRFREVPESVEARLRRLEALVAGGPRSIAQDAPPRQGETRQFSVHP